MKSLREPPIIVTKHDLERLRGFISATNLSPVADYLANELERAQVVESLEDAEAIVCLGSRVCFKDSANAALRNVTLVMPNEADIGEGRVSILTPVGAALLGLSAGQEITFTLPNGTDRALSVISVGG